MAGESRKTIAVSPSGSARTWRRADARLRGDSRGDGALPPPPPAVLRHARARRCGGWIGGWAKGAVARAYRAAGGQRFALHRRGASTTLALVFSRWSAAQLDALAGDGVGRDWRRREVRSTAMRSIRGWSQRQASGAPVLSLSSAVAVQSVRQIEHVPVAMTVVTDFKMIKPGFAAPGQWWIPADRRGGIFSPGCVVGAAKRR